MSQHDNDTDGARIESNDRITENKTSQIPDGFVFWEILQQVGKKSYPDDNSAVKLIQSELDLNEFDAREFLYRMNSAHKFIRRDEVGIEEQISCEAGAPRASGDDIYRILDAIFEENVNIAEKHLELLKKDIGPEKATGFQQWLDRQKPKMSYRKFDYKEQLKRRGISPDTVIARICGTDTDPH